MCFFLSFRLAMKLQYVKRRKDLSFLSMFATKNRPPNFHEHLRASVGIGVQRPEEFVLLHAEYVFV